MFLVLACAAIVPAPVNLDSITLNEAMDLDGTRVVAGMFVAKPSYFWKGDTVVGAPETFDLVERIAILRGQRYNVDDERISVVGTLHIIRHHATVVNGFPVPAWWEIRVVEGR